MVLKFISSNEVELWEISETDFDSKWRMTNMFI